MEIEFHGAASEVGRSCIEITTSKGNRYLLDVGVKFKEDGLQLPENVNNINEVDGVFLSHAHLDHAGGLPLFEHNKLKGPIFCTRKTFTISKILLKDSYKIARIKHLHPAYNNTDIKDVQKDTLFVSFDKWYKHKDIKFMYLNAGHIPGSAMILIETDEKRILYTADFNNRKTLLMKPAAIPDSLKKKRIDALIIESTYGYRELPDQDELRKKFVDSIKETVSKKGCVVIPVFSLGRAQEVLLMLRNQGIQSKIYVEGMCNKITRKIVSSKDKYVEGHEGLKEMFHEKIEWIGSEKRRKQALKNPGIFIATSGMVQGGPISSYIREIWHNSRNKIILMGFQCKRTNGRYLADEGFLYLDGWKTHVKCEVEKYDFSGHADSKGIKSFVEQLKPEKVFFQHGDEEAVNTMKQWAEKNTKSEAHAPVIGSKYSL